MRLQSVYDLNYLKDGFQVSPSLKTLYALLAERTEDESISHKRMPTWDEHVGFVMSEPYLAWYIIIVDGESVGAIYLSKQREIGIGIFKEYRRLGYAYRAIQMLMQAYPGKFLANINPKNHKSIQLFKNLGFAYLGNHPDFMEIQQTYIKQDDNVHE